MNESSTDGTSTNLFWIMVQLQGCIATCPPLDVRTLRMEAHVAALSGFETAANKLICDPRALPFFAGWELKRGH